MDNQVFLFGSFSKDEASQFQSVSEAPKSNSMSNMLNNTFPQMENAPRILINEKMLSPRVLEKSTDDEEIKQEDSIQFQSIQEIPKLYMPSMSKQTSPQMTSKVEIPVDEALISALMMNKSTIDEEMRKVMDIDFGRADPLFCNGSAKMLTTENSRNHVLNNAVVHEEPISFDLDRPKLDKSGNCIGLIEDSKLRGNIKSLDSSHKSISSHDSDVFQSKTVPKTWAALLDTDSDPTKKQGKVGVEETEEMLITELSGELWKQSLNNLNLKGKRLQPRGLINKGNLCFLTATLQALLSCSPFVHLLHTLQVRGVPKVGFPTLRACVDFFKEFEFLERDGKGSVEVAKPFLPSMFDSVLHSFNPDQPTTGFARNRQEDAQEFLSFTMDQLHNELLCLEGAGQISASNVNHTTVANEDDDWETVGPKNRTAVVRTHTFNKSALSDIFGGELCSVVKTKGSKASVTVQPFLVLHLDILSEAVYNVEDALKLFAAPETLEGYKSMAGKAVAVGASKSLKLQTLPRVLILHLKRFSYGSQGSSKLHKVLHFPLNLTLGRDLLATANIGTESRNYELVATVTHHGKDPSRGHYTTHSKQLDGKWLRYDDGVVSVVSHSRVLQEQVYLLFYRRLGL